MTFTDCLSADVLPCSSSLTADEMAIVFFKNQYCENGLPLEIILDHNKLFISCFWKALHSLTGTKVKLSTLYHPEMDGASACTNKTVNQMLCYHVKWSQKG